MFYYKSTTYGLQSVRITVKADFNEWEKRSFMQKFLFSTTALYISKGVNHKFMFHYQDFVVLINQCFSNFPYPFF